MSSIVVLDFKDTQQRALQQCRQGLSSFVDKAHVFSHQAACLQYIGMNLFLLTRLGDYL